MGDESTSGSMFTATFLHCDMNGKENILPVTKRHGHSIKMDVCKTGHFNGEVVKVSRHGSEDMYDTVDG